MASQTRLAHVDWIEPALLWEAGSRFQTLRRPRLIEVRSDSFMDEFMAAMRSQAAYQYMQDHVLGVAPTAVKLYQPMHQRYYLISGSLVCKQVGLPDRVVARKDGDSTSFVIRRITLDANGALVREEAWVIDGERQYWVPLADGRALHAQEERFPLSPLPVCTQSAPGLDAYRMAGDCERIVYHGYIATGGRSKYQATPLELPAPTPAAAYRAFNALIRSPQPGAPQEGQPPMDEFDTRVIGPWQNLITRRNDLGSASADLLHRREMALFILIDCADFLDRALPDVWDALVRHFGGQNSANFLSDKPQRRALFDALVNSANDPVWRVSRGGTLISVGRALVDQNDGSPSSLDKMRDGTIIAPIPDYRLQDASSSLIGTPASKSSAGTTGQLKTRVEAALLEAGDVPMTVSDDLIALLTEQVRVPPSLPAGQTQVYWARLVYEYTYEDCPYAIVSEPSQTFTFAGIYDPDAPARKVRIEMPSIKLQDMRKFKPGVGMQMSPELRDVMNRIHEGMLDKEGLLAGSAGWELGMICTFSIQIIMLIALVVMFIFAILLNIVFWWLPLLKICFPIPKKA